MSPSRLYCDLELLLCWSSLLDELILARKTFDYNIKFYLVCMIGVKQIILALFHRYLLACILLGEDLLIFLYVLFVDLLASDFDLDGFHL